MNESPHTTAQNPGNPGKLEEPLDSASVRTAAASSESPPGGAGDEFTPFEKTIVCPGCNRPLQMMLQPVHATIQIRCPRCVRQLTPLIRRAIREHQVG
ncbi:MAG: hypothetical protein RIF32_12200 [Leptospirales bacterium]|jgi:phage FluMu protein Com